MRAICIDDEELVLKLTVSMCEAIPQLDEVRGFTTVKDAMDWLKLHTVDLAILDIDMPEMNGIALAAKLKSKYPSISIIFLTGYSEYAVEAFEVHASGYLLKPLNKDNLNSEIEYALARKRTRLRSSAHIAVRTFGEFDVFVDGKIVTFGRSKAKELLAFLIDRQGEKVTRAQIAGALWEEGHYDRAMQKQIDVIVRSLRSTLEEYGIGIILGIDRGTIRVNKEFIDCDLFRFLEGDVDVIDRYRGEYMSSYSWANLTEGYITSSLSKSIY